MALLADLQASDELVIALVGPIGTDLDSLESAIRETFERCAYRCVTIKLTNLMRQLSRRPWNRLDALTGYERYEQFMTAGNDLRELLERGDALAMLGVTRMRDIRMGETRKGLSDRRVFIVHSLKHPDEVDSLRRVYGPALLLIAAYSPPGHRLKTLASRITESRHEFHIRQAFPEAQKLIRRDESETGKAFGQNVRKAFPKADFFVDTSIKERIIETVERISELVLGNTFHTPTRDEFGMFHAQAGALRSASLQRQVGAAISTTEGDIIAVGANEVPKAGGGLYWAGDSPDFRDFVLGYETSDVLKRRMLNDIISRLKEKHFLSRAASRATLEMLVAQILEAGILSEAQVMNILEFGRCVHAEMAAITDAARRGVSVRGCTLYTTTFPCHECARHIVAAGIKRVVYIEPYPKSLVPELYPDSVAIDDPPTQGGSEVEFEPFVGVAPRRYLDLFSMGSVDRKDKMGKAIRWRGIDAKPRLGEYSFRTGLINFVTETVECKSFLDELSNHRLLG